MSKDKMKQLTHKKYTAYDLNCPKIYKPKWRKKLGQKIKRAARRKLKSSIDIEE